MVYYTGYCRDKSLEVSGYSGKQSMCNLSDREGRIVDHNKFFSLIASVLAKDREALLARNVLASSSPSRVQPLNLYNMCLYRLIYVPIFVCLL